MTFLVHTDHNTLIEPIGVCSICGGKVTRATYHVRIYRETPPQPIASRNGDVQCDTCGAISATGLPVIAMTKEGA